MVIVNLHATFCLENWITNIPFNICRASCWNIVDKEPAVIFRWQSFISNLTFKLNKFFLRTFSSVDISYLLADSLVFFCFTKTTSCYRHVIFSSDYTLNSRSCLTVFSRDKILLFWLSSLFSRVCLYAHFSMRLQLMPNLLCFTWHIMQFLSLQFWLHSSLECKYLHFDLYF